MFAGELEVPVSLDRMGRWSIRRLVLVPMDSRFQKQSFAPVVPLNLRTREVIIKPNNAYDTL